MRTQKIIVLFLAVLFLPSCRPKYRFELKDAVLYADSNYISLKLINTGSKRIIKVDLLDNYLEDSTRVVLEPAECCVESGDSTRLKFYFHDKPNPMDMDYVMVTELYVRYNTTGDMWHRISYPASNYGIHNIYSSDYTQRHLLARQRREEKYRERQRLLEEQYRDQHEFRFLGRSSEHDENFNDTTVTVTLDNVEFLYRSYEVSTLIDSTLLLIKSKALYYDAPYLSRIICFDEGKQVAARTFYNWIVIDAFEQGDSYLIAMNSPISSAGATTPSFTCKTILLSKPTLEIINEREYRYPEQRDAYYAVACIDTIYQNGNNGYFFRIFNVGFDAEDYYQYEGILNRNNVVVSSEKKHIFIH